MRFSWSPPVPLSDSCTARVSRMMSNFRSRMGKVAGYLENELSTETSETKKKKENEHKVKNTNTHNLYF